MQGTLSAARPFHPERSRSSVDFIVIWLCVLALTAVAAFAGWQFWHADRIFTGVQVAGVPVGGMTRAAALVKLSREVPIYPVPPVSVQYEGREWILSSAQITPTSDWMAAVNEAYLIGRRGGIPDQLVAQIGALLGAYDVRPPLHFDQGIIRYELSQIAAQVRRPGRAALQIGETTLPSQPGVDVDLDASARRVLAALHSGKSMTVPLETVTVTPPDAAPAETATTTTSLLPLRLRHPESGLQFALDAAMLADLVPGGQVDRLNEEALRQLVQAWAEEIEMPAQDARLRFDVAANQPVVVQPSVTGRRLDVEQTVQTIRDALRSGQTQAALPIETVAPTVDSNRIGEMGIKELIAAGTTYFKGSSAARIRNIEVAAEKFEGVVIPPNGIFSFNSIVRDVSAANGFEDSLIILGDTTAVGVGGGVCQVSTTVFRAALNAGFPIVERYNHGYVVSWYGDPGMDATIYTPTVDFKFRNDTNAYLLVQPVVDSVNGVITFNFYGTKPDRQVIISEPVITDVKEPGEPVYKEDPSIAPGQRKQVEYAVKGMTATVERTVIENGETRTDTIVSKYQPWNAVYLVAPGEAPPTPTPEVTTTPTDNTETASTQAPSQ